MYIIIEIIFKSHYDFEVQATTHTRINNCVGEQLNTW